MFQKLLKSISWKLLPYAGLELATESGMHFSVANRGAWGSYTEVFVGRVYAPFLPHLQSVRGWVDLGCNNGFFSYRLLDQIVQTGGPAPRTRVLLGDADEQCVAAVSRTIEGNPLAADWKCQHVVVGPPGESVTFSQMKDSTHSSIFARRNRKRAFRYPSTDLNALTAGCHGVFDLVKIDIEGAEKILFEHHGDLLRRFRYGLCEWHAPEFDGSAQREAIERAGFKVIELRSQAVDYDLARGHSWDSPLGMVLWENPAPLG